jgi:hypothetical protein
VTVFADESSAGALITVDTTSVGYAEKTTIAHNQIDHTTIHNNSHQINEASGVPASIRDNAGIEPA